jgi:hypothetical protein
MHQPLSRPKSIRAGEYTGGRKIGLEKVKMVQVNRVGGDGLHSTGLVLRHHSSGIPRNFLGGVFNKFS